MATPLHLPALPTAAPVTVDVGGRVLSQSRLADDYALRKVDLAVASGKRLIQIVAPLRRDERRLALAAALEIGGPILALAETATRRNHWRAAFRKLETLAESADPQIVSRRTSSLTSITIEQLRGLFDSKPRASALDRPPLNGLSVLLLDCARLRAGGWGAVSKLLRRNARHAPVVLALAGASPGPLLAGQRTAEQLRSGRRARRTASPGSDTRALRARRIAVEPALQVLEQQMAPYQELFWLSPVAEDAEASVRERTERAEEICLHLAEDASEGTPGLRRWVDAMLPHPPRADASMRTAYLSAIARARRWTLSLISVHRALGGRIPSSVRSVIEPVLPERAGDAEWAQVLARYYSHLDPHRPAALRRRRLIRMALDNLGYTAVDGRAVVVPRYERQPSHESAAADILVHEREQKGHLRAVVLADPLTDNDPISVARTVSADVPVVAVAGSALWCSPRVMDDVVRVARPLATELDMRLRVDRTRGFITIVRAPESCRDGVARNTEDRIERVAALHSIVEWAGAALRRGVVEAVVCPPRTVTLLAASSPSLVGRVNVVVDACNDAEASPLPLLAGPLLSPRGTRRAALEPERVVNLWRVLGVGQNGLARRTLTRAARNAEHVASMSGDGRLQFACPGLRDLLSQARRHPNGGLPERELSLFNRRQLRRARNPRLAAAHWQSARARRRHLTVEVTFEHRSRARSHRRDLPLGPGAQMSERRARNRLRRYRVGRRRIALNTAAATVVSALLLPFVAGPILGSLVAVASAMWILGNGWKRQQRNRMRTLYRPSSGATVVRDIACVVLRTLRSCEGIRQAELPTSSIRCSPVGDHRLSLWLDHSDERLSRQFARTLVEALQPVGDQRYIIGRPQTRVPTRRQDKRNAFKLHLASYHPVPAIFAARRERAELYAGHWSQMFGPGKLRYTGGGKGRLLRFAHYGRNHIRIRARTVLTLG